jgi:colicin import membrane protein
VPAKVLGIFERALDEQVAVALLQYPLPLMSHTQKHDLDAQPLESDYVDSTLSVHREAESKVMELACKITPQSPRCTQIAAERAARAEAQKNAAADAKAKASAEQAKIIADAVAKATADESAQLKAALDELARAKTQAAAEVKAAKEEAKSELQAAEAKTEAPHKVPAPVSVDLPKQHSASVSSASKSK